MPTATVARCLMAGTFCLLAAGCDEKGNTFLPRPVPPVTVTYRDSADGVGKVVLVANNSTHHLYNVKVTGRNFDTNASASVRVTEHLRPGESVEVGRLQFESWVPESGETIEVYCDDYVVPHVSIVPE